MTSVVRLARVSVVYGRKRALDDVSLEIPAGRIVGLIGPDGVGKSTLLALVSGSHAVATGRVEVLGGDISDAGHRDRTCPRIAYMPQGLGKNLYPTLSVAENIDFFARLFGHARHERKRRIDDLLRATNLTPFASRPAGKLSGGMKQKLGLCCALIHDPDLLILDEPTTGVDPLSRRQFWGLIDDIRRERPSISVVVASAYMEEAARFDWLVAMDEGKVLATGTPAELLSRTGTDSLDAAFIALLPEEKRRDHAAVSIPPLPPDGDGEPIIAAEALTMEFDGFTAVDGVSFRIERGEIFGFVGSNGCGKTTTMKMLTGLLSPTHGTARLMGQTVDARDLGVRRRVGYMSQSFSLYTELTVAQNLALHARLFGLDPGRIEARVGEMAERFELVSVLDALPDGLPLGLRQRLSLAVAMIHGPEILILDEPTSGVDPVARDRFWRILGELSREDGVTIFVSTHFMKEAALCDRVALMHAGRLLACASPAAIVAARGATSLEEAFIGHLEDSGGATEPRSGRFGSDTSGRAHASPPLFDPRRLLAYTQREAMELRRDPIRATLAFVGSVILMFVIGYGINMDVENLRFAVLDRDGTALSREYVDQIAGSRYFVETRPIADYADLDRRMRDGEIALAIEIPPGFARDVGHGRDVQIGAWIDGAMPSRSETVKGYVQGMHAGWLAEKARERYGPEATRAAYDLRVRYRYNPSVESLVAMVPAVIPLLLLMIPAMLAALSVVREKELGSIVNFYVTPVTRFEFLVGKQLPYLALAFANYLMVTALAVFVFRVPLTGSFAALSLAATLYVVVATTLGLVISTFMRTQIAAIFGTAIGTLIPAIQFCGVIDPVSSLQGAGAVIGRVYPTSHFITVSRGVFSKGLEIHDLTSPILALAISIPILLAAGVLLLRKQAH